MNYAIIVPIYYENQRTLQLCRELNERGAGNIVVVNDGAKLSKPFMAEMISMGCSILRFERTKGRGYCIKAGMKYAHEKFQPLNGFITVDCDSEHSADDVMKIARAMDLRPDSVILGKRNLKRCNMKFSSKLGVRFSALYFKIITGVSCGDTQTELTGIPVKLFETAIRTKGNRFDFDLNFLTECAEQKIELYPVNIDIIYTPDNRSSYKMIKDTYLIYSTPLKFATFSLGCALIDLILFTVLCCTLPTGLTLNVIIATILARLVSGGINFLINRKVIFKDNGNVKKQLKKYGILFGIIMTASTAIVASLSFIPIPVTIIKIFIDLLLWVINYTLQRKWVFRAVKG